MFHALRLHPGDDLLESLRLWTTRMGIRAGAVVTCVGSLREAHLRLANRDSGTRLHQKMEILSLSGTLSPDGPHLHLGLSDGDGRCLGGHVLEGCLVSTTAELVIVELADWSFARVPDPATGYRELVPERASPPTAPPS